MTQFKYVVGRDVQKRS